VADIAAGRYEEKIKSANVRTLSRLLDEWIEHGETRVVPPARSVATGRRPYGSRPGPWAMWMLR
jgi:hypothetical protein